MELSTLSERLVDDLLDAIEQRRPATVSYPISNVDRTIGARVSGEIATRYGEVNGNYDGTVAGHFVWGKGKLAAVEEWLLRERLHGATLA